MKDSGIAGNLSQHIQDIALHYENSQQSYNPVLTLWQSSGYGKTRACKELARNAPFRVVHFLCSAEHSQGNYVAEEPMKELLSKLKKSQPAEENGIFAEFLCRVVNASEEYVVKASEGDVVDYKKLFKDQWETETFYEKLGETIVATTDIPNNLASSAQ
jgi:nitrogenase molybdenum-iron protein alpha/beta subunit